MGDLGSVVVQGGKGQAGGGFVGGEHNVQGEGVGFSEFSPFPIPVLFPESYKLKGGGRGWPSHDQEVGVPVKEGVAKQGHFVPDGFGVRLGSTDTGFLTERFLKVNARVPITESNLDRHGAEGLTVGGGGILPFVFVLSGAPTHKLDVFDTGEGVFHEPQGLSGILFLFCAEINSLAGQINGKVVVENFMI